MWSSRMQGTRLPMFLYLQSSRLSGVRKKGMWLFRGFVIQLMEESFASALCRLSRVSINTRSATGRTIFKKCIQEVSRRLMSIVAVLLSWTLRTRGTLYGKVRVNTTTSMGRRRSCLWGGMMKKSFGMCSIGSTRSVSTACEYCLTAEQTTSGLNRSSQEAGFTRISIHGLQNGQMILQTQGLIIQDSMLTIGGSLNEC